MNSKKGFTLVELLAVIVILAIIMLIAIPAVLDTVQSSRKKTFVTYVDKIGNLSMKKYLEKSVDDEISGGNCVIYNIKEDLDLSTVGDFKGYVLITSEEDTNISYITLWNDEYMLIGYNYTEGRNNKGEKKTIDESLEIYDNSRKEELKPANLCSFACSSCLYETADKDPFNNDSEQNISGEVNKPTLVTTLISGQEFNDKVSSLSGENKCRLSTSNCTNLKEIRKSNSLSSSAQVENVSKSDDISQDNPVYIWYENGILYYYTKADKIYLNLDSSEMFKGFKGLSNMSELIKNIYSDNVTTMYEMFYNCNSLISLDLSHFNTSKVSNMSDTFAYCNSLTSINVSNFNTQRVETMSYLFQFCESLTNLDLSSFRTQNVKTMYAMFYKCYLLNELDISNFDTSNVENMGEMFGHCESITSLNLLHFNTSKVNDMHSIFYYCEKLSDLNISSFNTSNVTNMREMFYRSTKLTTIKVKVFDTSNVTNSSDMFYGCEKLPNYTLEQTDKEKANTSSNGYLTL